MSTSIFIYTPTIFQLLQNNLNPFCNIKSCINKWYWLKDFCWLRLLTHLMGLRLDVLLVLNSSVRSGDWRTETTDVVLNSGYQPTGGWRQPNSQCCQWESYRAACCTCRTMLLSKTLKTAFTLLGKKRIVLLRISIKLSTTQYEQLNYNVTGDY